MDLIIGVLVFMLAVGIIYSLLVGKSKDDVTPLRIESEVIADKLTRDPGIGVAFDNQLNKTKLASLANIDYDALRKELGVQGEFCIYLSDADGNIIYIVNETTNATYAGIGSGNGDFNVSCITCTGPSICKSGAAPGEQVNCSLPCGRAMPSNCRSC